MRVYLAQHGEAKSKEEDAERPLSDKGKRDVKRVADFLYAHARPAIPQVVHSGKRRAAETAEIMMRGLDAGQLQKAPDLDPMADPGIWSAHLAAMHEDIMLVGHLPHLGRLASLLLVGDSERPLIAFHMGGVVCLSREGTGWLLEWMLTPGLIA